MFLKNLFKVTKGHRLLFHLYEMFRKSKSTQTESRSVVVRGCGEGDMGSDLIDLCRMMKMS